MLSALIALAVAGQQLPALTANEAEEELSRAQAFVVGPAGLPAVRTKPSIAFRVVMGAPDAAKRLGRLTSGESSAGKLYGLCGLFFWSPAIFESEFERLRASEEPVTVQTFDMRATMPLRRFVTPRADAPRLPHQYKPSLFNAEAVRDFPGGAWCYALRTYSEGRW